MPKSFRVPDGPSQAKIRRLIRAAVHFSGGTLKGKLRLNKIAWLAHTTYARETAGYLTDWPIVHLPEGPAIDDLADVIADMRDDGELIVVRSSIGMPNAREDYSLPPGYKPDEDLAAMGLHGYEAIRDAVELFKDMKGAEISDYAHENSATWRSTSNGDPQSVGLDNLDEAEYHAEMKRTRELEDELERLGFE